MSEQDESFVFPMTAEARIDTLLLGCTHYPLLSGAIRGIGFVHRRRQTTTVQCGGGPQRGVGVAVVREVHTATFASQRIDDRRSDPATSAGDQRDLVLQSEFHAPTSQLKTAPSRPRPRALFRRTDCGWPSAHR